MSLTPTAPHIVAVAEESFSGLWERITGFFGGQGFAPRAPLEQTPGIDPRFIPRAPMSNANLDVGLLAKLSHEGFKRGKEITAATHPELHHIWTKMCGRAGLNRVPQLVLCDSKAMNAASLHGENAVMISDEMFRRLNLREVSAVLGHELGHESSDHLTSRALAMTAFGGAGLLVGDELAHRGGIGSLIPFEKMENGRFKKALSFLFASEKKPLTVLGSIIYMAVGAWVGSIPARHLTVHPTELDADRKGAQISGDPQGLASALSKLEPAGTKRSLARHIRFWTSGYPSTENRIAKLHAMAQAMPPGVTPVYQEVEGATFSPKGTNAAALSEVATAPSPQVSSIGVSERVAAEPAPAPAL